MRERSLIYAKDTVIEKPHAAGRKLDQISARPLRNIKLKEVAQKANRAVSMVSQVITGVKNSEAVGLALAQMLGYDTYKELMNAAWRETKGGAAWIQLTTE